MRYLFKFTKDNIYMFVLSYFIVLTKNLFALEDCLSLLQTKNFYLKTFEDNFLINFDLN